MADAPSAVVIVGASLAGAKTAEALRENGYGGAVTLIGAESELPYERPPLSKDYLAGKAEFADEIVHPQDWYGEHEIDLRLGSEVSAVLPESREVELAGGERIGYGALVLATGAKPRRPPIPGADAALTLRTHADSDVLRATFGEGKKLVIVGGGWIGLEAAAAACAAGTDVTLLESAELPLLGVLGREMAAVFADLHREHGVDLRLGADIERIEADRVRLADGTELAANAVLLAVGIAPRVELAESAGLDVDNGVLVDTSLRTSDPAIYAVGDVANQDHPLLGRRVRVEHWANALNQPAVVAKAILGGPDVYDRLPYFFSDQYDLGMEYAGYVGPDGYARVLVRGDLDGREFVAFWLDDQNHILAAMNVNVWDVLDDIRPLITSRTVIDPDKLTDPSVPYAQVGSDERG